jgi:CBS domain-containing protein
MRAKHVMTKNPSSCAPSDSAQHVARIMRDQDAGIVPVIDNELSRKVVGVVTDRDLCMNIVAEGRPPHAVSVEECMTTKVVICSPNDSIDKATELMRDNQIRRVTVVNESGQLLGIVALADVVERADVKTTQTHETLKSVSAPSRQPSKPRAQSRKAA